MKGTIVTAIAVCFFVAVLPSWAQDSASKPKMEIVEPVYDAGDIYRTTPKIEHSFVIKNTGTADLQILKARPGCGCTVTEFDKVIVPNATGKVNATVDISHFKGNIEKGIDIETNDPTQAKAHLSIKANVKTLVEMKPADQVRFTLNKGETKKQEMTLVPTYETPFQIKSARVDKDMFGVDLLPPAAGSDTKEYKLDVTVKNTAPIGTQSGLVLLELEGAPFPSLEIPIIAIVRGPITTKPALVSLQIKRFPEEVMNSNPLNMRQQPDLSAPVIMKLDSGKHLRVIAQRDGWYQVITDPESKKTAPTSPSPRASIMNSPEGSRIGWINSKLVKISKEPVSTTNETISIQKLSGNFKILEYTSTNPDIKLELNPTEKEAQAYTLKVSLSNPDQIKKNMPPGSIVIKTNDSDQPEIKIPVYVIVS
jgi:hypothetical protein